MHPLIFALLCTVPFLAVNVWFFLKAAPVLDAASAAKGGSGKKKSAKSAKKKNRGR